MGSTGAYLKKKTSAATAMAVAVAAAVAPPQTTYKHATGLTQTFRYYRSLCV